MESTTITLDPWDAAIILKKDGTYETSFPHVTESQLPENVIIGAALAFALQNKQLCEAIRENFEKQCLSKFVKKRA
ncbi:hypothetical protein Bealeia1_00047 [Candidatus Bealeia paramacronuclearis]|uniref:Uncharacterized protein n=1 Tax=Candidatus Bealeia paramacronuclearis TaxID=1921001 RepID=A0ABZ2C2K0_9PROT|nr:hypothetical protein [Candidatus Bealeia paramacronuclearis]